MRSILTLPAIVDAVDGRVPVLVDGSFRRGTDILKALAFGAQARAGRRPAMWGLAAYGADGVQGVVEMLQTELARYMAMCGKSHLAMLDRTMLRVHGARRARTAGEREPLESCRRASEASASAAVRREAASRLEASMGRIEHAGGTACRGARRSPRWPALVAGSPLVASGCRRSWIRVRSRSTGGCPGSTR